MHLLKNLDDVVKGEDFQVHEIYGNIPFLELETANGNLWTDTAAKLATPRYTHAHTHAHTRTHTTGQTPQPS